MDTTALDAAVAAAEEAQASACAVLEAAIEQFSSALVSELKGWLPTSIKNETKRQAGVTEKRGLAGMQALKAEVNQLLGDLPHIVEKTILRSRHLWRHRADWLRAGEGLEWKYTLQFESGKTQRPPEVMTKAIEDLLRDHAASALLKNGYRGHNTLGNRRYPETFPWSETLKDLARPLASKLKEYEEAARATADAKKARALAVADELWDQP